MIRLAKWYLSRHGYIVTTQRMWDEIAGRVKHIDDTMLKSGHLNTLASRRPKVVRRLDREIGGMMTLMDGVVNWDDDEIRTLDGTVISPARKSGLALVK